MATGNSLNAMIAAVAYELGQRTDLQANGTIERYIRNSIEIYQKERFRFNELQPIAPFVVNTVQGQSVYGVADDARIPQLYKIDFINYRFGNMPVKMSRVFPEDVYLAIIPGQQAGPPQEWAWDGQAIVIYPPPPATVYPLTIGGYLAVAAPGTDAAGLADTTNVWMNDAEMLIRSRAKFEIAQHVTRNKELMELMSPVEGSDGAADRAYRMLKGEANKIRATSRVRPMPF